ncbi:hypothetical protein B0H14DRAFT_2586895 [Mycena olivaceomarginata]|nr:hypothetical protein B0H14DRAFT_2586895 [Mycena olivaceomarginata]
MHDLLATSTISSREELMGAIATVDELVVRAVHLTRTAQVLTRTAEDVARTAQDLQDIWVRATAKSPTEVAINHANATEGQRVYEEADTQIKGCPGQQYRCKTSKREANEVEKWVEMRDD